MKLFNFFLLLWVIFVLLDPDPDPDSESGSTDPIESGSNSHTQPFLNPLPRSHASPRSIKFPSATSQARLNCVSRQRSTYVCTRMYVSLWSHIKRFNAPTKHFPSPFDSSADFSQPHSDIFGNFLPSWLF
jgi:hypothetical protein